MKNLTLAVVLFPALASAAGFQLQERSARGLGRAFSGEAAIADDASVLASNPAAMLLVPGDTAVSAGLSGIFPEIAVRGTYQPPPMGAPQPASARADETSYVPFLFVTHRVNDRLALGFGSFTTYGLITNYPDSFSARLLADKSELRSLNLNPSLAWRVSEKWSIGAGFNTLRADGTLSATVPTGQPALLLKGDDWGDGFNVGILFEAGPHTRFGLHYRSEVDLTLDGDARSVSPALSGPATLDVTLPDSIEFSAYHEFDDRWALHADVIWTSWSDFDRLVPVVNGAVAGITPENWDDAFRFALGVTCRAHEKITLRAGLAYDQSPVSDRFRTLRIPDADRIWLSFGASYHVNAGWSIDAGYTHLFIDPTSIRESTPAGGTFTGRVEGSADLVALGLSGHF